MTKKVIDISATGMAFLATELEATIFQPGVRLKNLSFTLRGRKITVSADVRHARPFRARSSNASGAKVGSYVFEETRRFYTKFL